MFDQELRNHIGQRVQVVTPTEIVSGILLSVTEGTLTVRTTEYPGYGDTEDVIINLSNVAYVRVFS